MHYKEFARLKDFGRYNANISLFELDEKLESLRVRDGLNLEPDFQRQHEWTVAQQVAFVEFMLKGGRTSSLLFNHPGWMKDFEGEFVCVDGLQRITALRAFTGNRLKVFGGYLRKDLEEIDILLKNVYLNYYINDLKTRLEVVDWYLEVNTGGTPHSDYAIQRVRVLRDKELGGAELPAVKAEPPKKPKIVCLCGSTRFLETFATHSRLEALKGNIVLSVSASDKVLGGGDREIPLTDEEKIALDHLHLRKIDLCDWILVLNVGGYIGQSTSNEIAYAMRSGKPVIWLHPDRKWANPGHEAAKMQAKV